MHGESCRLRGWKLPEVKIRVTASTPGESWVYQFPPEEWTGAVRRIMADTRDGKIPDEAAGGLLELIAEGLEG